MILKVFRTLAACLVFIAGAALQAQSTVDTGSLRGKVTDDKGGPLPGAIVRAKGPQGIKAAQTDLAGNYSIGFLTPGVYEVTATLDGFNTVMQAGVEVSAQRTSQQPFKLAAGSGGETVVVKGTGTKVDTTSTTSQTSVNLATAIETFARDRSLTSTFDFSPGVLANSGVGGGNPSISGASGLENQYLIGGVNITNTGYGGIGAYDAVLGASGVGVTTDFLEDLDIREGGFEAEYGGALGGVISASIKSGSNDFHGGVAAYFTPRSLNGSRRDIFKAGGFNNPQGSNQLDASVQFGGPIVKDRLFFFVAYNPVWTRNYSRFDIDAADIAKDAIVLPNANREYDFGQGRVDNYAAHLTWQINEKHKLDFIAFGSPSERDGLQDFIGRRVRPSDDPGVNVLPLTGGVPNTDPDAGAGGSLRITDRSFSLKYFGTIAAWMNVEAQVSYHLSRVEQTPTAASDVIQYTDIRRTQIFNSQTANAGQPGIPATPIVSPAQYVFGGLGRFQGGSNDRNLDYTLKITHNFNWAGSHELKWGGEYADIKFRENPIRSGPRDTNGSEIYLQSAASLDSYVRIRTGASAQLRCRSVVPSIAIPFGSGSACDTPRYRLNRGNFNPATLDTTNKESSFFLQDKWSVNNHLTLNLGVRYTRSEIANPTDFSMASSRTGNPLLGTNGQPVGTTDPNCVLNADPANPNCYLVGPGEFVGGGYRFKGEWAPRIGLSWDLMGNGKSKLYANFARMYERVPQDLAIRSFGNEFGLVSATFSAPDLTGQTQGVLTVGGDSTTVAPGTRLPYKDDFILGYQFEVAPRFLIDVKGSYRRQGRVLEDTQAATVEAIENLYYNSLIGLGCINCAPGQTELFPGAGYARFQRYVLANVGENGPASFNQVYPNGTWIGLQCPGETALPGNPPNAPDCDGQPTGATTPVSFGSPQSKYKALSITATKQRTEGGHLSLQATYRISRLTGNYEGLFRNDNGQKDPNISSLFDFPNSPLTRAQFFGGRLNNDTPHALRINVGWEDLLIKNLSAAVTFKWNSGTLRTPYLAHPNYQNAGEIPGINPQYYNFDFNSDGYGDLFLLRDYTAVRRGENGRNEDIATWDFKLGYRWNLGRSNLDCNILVQNVFNNNAVTSYDNFVESTTGVLNPLYNTPNGAHDPRSVRLGMKWSF
jgi:outer membrane receptor protein involved in Fe transport